MILRISVSPLKCPSKPCATLHFLVQPLCSLNVNGQSSQQSRAMFLAKSIYRKQAHSYFRSLSSAPPPLPSSLSLTPSLRPYPYSPQDEVIQVLCQSADQLAKFFRQRKADCLNYISYLPQSPCRPADEEGKPCLGQRRCRGKGRRVGR